MLLKDKLQDKELILASHSPRRRELMEGAGLSFIVADSYEVEEIYPDDLPAAQVAAYLARLKSLALPRELSGGEILVTADTVVLLNGELLGKPSDAANARRTLRSLSGQKHTVVTGVVIRDCEGSVEFDVATDVWFRELTEQEIDYYLANYAPFDKAGSYGIQEWIGYVAIEKIEGSFYNVMGLPIQTLYVALDKFLSRNVK